MYAIRFKHNGSDNWTFCTDMGEAELYATKEEAEQEASRCNELMSVFDDGYIYEVVEMINERDYINEKHLQTDAEEPEIQEKEKMITVQLTEMEISMLIGSLTKTYYDYKKPNKTAQCRNNAYKYKDLSMKLYNILLSDFVEV